MKRKFSMIILTLTLALCSILGLTACGGNNENGNDDNPPHIHEFTTLKYDTTNHWFECECGDKKDIENHKGGTATETNKATCSVCNQEYGESLGHVHTLHLTKVDAKPQSCTKEGNREYYTCSCGKWFTNNSATTEITDKTSVVIAKDAHKYETLKKTATEHWWECSCGDKDGLEEHHGGNATCTQKAVCTDCGVEYGSLEKHNYTELKKSATQHWYECVCGDKKDIENHKPGAEATETSDQKCTVCNYVITPALGHVHTLHLTKVDAKPQSCTEEGNIEYYVCSCGKWFTENIATTEITDKNSVVIKKDDHKYETLKKTATEHWWECSCDAYETKENHIPGAEATETTDQKCTECNYVIAPALGHVHTLHLTKVYAKQQSCTATGNIEYYTCSCGKWFRDNTATTEITDKTSVVIEKDAHKYETLNKTATEHWWECSCGDKDGLEEHHGGNAICTQKAVCTDCGVEYGSLEKHNYAELKKSSTQHWYECSCGAYETKENHKGGTATCQVKATCLVCDTIYGDFAEHEPKTAWIITDTHHYHECVYGCNEKLNYSEHSFTDYVSNKDATYESDGTKTAQCDGGCGKTHTVTDAGSMLIKDEIRFTTLNVDGKNVYGKVSYDTIEFVFYEEIFVSGNATYVVDDDKSCSSPIASKTVDLVVGDNTFYVLETVGNNVKLYTVTIHRREMFTVTFNTNGGTAVDYQIVEEDSFATEPTTTKIGYTFDKWDYDFNTAITKDTVINAQWSINQYTITIVYNNGQEDLVLTQDYNSDIATVSNPTKTGYSFTGWDKTIPSKMPAEDLTITATWKINQYTITIVYNNGQANLVIKQDYNTDVETIANPEKTGYTFAGWDKTIPNKIPPENIKITASWNTIEYDIVYNLNGGKLTTVKNKYTIEQAVTFDNPNRDYYTFSGWYYNADFSGSNVDGIAVGSYGDIELYAKWTPIDYGITYVLNGGTNDKNNPTKYNVETSTIILNTPTRGGYTFDGWYLEETFATKVTQIEQGSHGDIKLYVKWTPIDYDITYVLDGGINDKTNPAKYNIETSTIVFKNPTKIGYTFDGWYLEETFATKVTKIEHGSHGNAKIYAKWLAIFTLSGGVVKGLTAHGETLSEIIVPKSIDNVEITSIGSYAFEDCDSLTSVKIPNSVTSIGYYAFRNCSSLTCIEIPDSVTSIGWDAFYDCDSLTSITIPDKVTSIKSSSFLGCSSLRSVIIGESVTSIGNSAFYGCSSLTSVYITNIEAWCNISFDNDTANPLNYSGNLYLNNELVTALEIPNTITEIKAYAFNNCDSLESVTIGSSVTSIGEAAFSSCSSLTNVTIGDGVTSIGKYAFQNCSSLTCIEIPDSVTSIGDWVFRYCSSLTSVVIGNSVTSIGSGAFYDCDSLTRLSITNGQ